MSPAAAPAAPAVDGRARSDDQRDDQNEPVRLALSALMRAYPVGAGVRFEGHLPVLSPRWWRKLAATSPWGSAPAMRSRWRGTGSQRASRRRCSSAG
jgi:hypothetical protein